MHPKVDGLKPLGPLALAGRDVYQREGCVNCHTQTVRPLKSEVVRYGGSRSPEPGGRYSIAGEFAYDHPFLWGSKRTGPDLAFEGWLKPAASWQLAHLRDPQAVVPRSNMPRYAFLEVRPIDAAEMQAHMRALRRVGVPYTDQEIAAAPAALQGKTEMDGLVAYLVSLGKAVDRGGAAVVEARLDQLNPVAGDAAAIARGKVLFAENCAACHGEGAEGTPDVAPSLVDDVFLEVKGDMPDAAYFTLVKGGSDAKKSLGRSGLADGGMPAFAGQLPDQDLWSIIAWIRERKAHPSGGK
jgi:cytochrome c oxidase cbb3-type subunit 2